MLTINMQSGDAMPEQALFDKVMVAGDKTILGAVKSLCSATYTNKFYEIVVAYTRKGKPASYTISLPITTVSLMKGTATQEQKLLCRKAILVGLNNILSDCGYAGAVGIPSDDLTQYAPAADLPDMSNFLEKNMPGYNPHDKDDAPLAGLIAEQGEALFDKYVPPKKVKAKPTGTTIKLANAKALMQPVRGTSEGSVYYVTALSPRVRVAMRYRATSGDLSIRAEGKPNPMEQASMLGMGMSENASVKGDTYYSMHVKLGKVEPQRALGAILFGLGIDFEETITSAKELVEKGGV